jgi:hypothetical protein
LTRPKPKLTVEALHASLQPPNNCRVKAFRDTLSDEEQEVLDEALGYDKRDYPAAQLSDWLLGVGFDAETVPGSDSINDHRAGRRPCRCRG